MAVTRTARGTAFSKTLGLTLDIAAQSLNARDLLVVYYAYDDATLLNVLWGTQQMTLGDSVLGNGVRVRLAWCEAEATESRTINATWATALTAKAMVADSFRSSVTTAGFVWNADANSTNTGLGTAATTPATAAIVGGTESIRVGVVGTEGPSGDAAGTWVEPNTLGQRTGSTGNPAASNVTASSAYRIAPTAGSTTGLSKTGMTSRDWGAGIRSFYWDVPPPVALAGTAAGVATTTADLTVTAGGVAVALAATAAGVATATADLTVTAAGGGGATFATVQTAPEQQGTDVSSLTATFDTGSTAGNTLIARIAARSASGSGSPTTSLPTGWVQAIGAGAATANKDPRVAIWYYPNNAGGITSVAMTLSATVDATFDLIEVQGNLELDKTASAFSDVASITASTGTTATTTAADELCVTLITNILTNTQASPTNSFVLSRKIGPTAHATGNQKIHSYHYSRIVSATGTYGHDVTISSTGRPWTGAIATFKAATAGGAVSLAATAAGVGATSADLTVTAGGGAAVSLAATAASVGAATASLSVNRPIAGSGAGTGTASGSLRYTATLASAAAGISSASGALRVTAGLAASVQGSGASSASIIVAKTFSAASNGTGTASGSLGVTQPLAGSASSAGSASGVLSVGIRFTGSSAGTGTATGSLATTRVLAASVQGTSSATAALAVAKALAAASAGAGTASGDLALTVRLQASASGTSANSADLSGAKALTASVIAQSSASVALTNENGTLGSDVSATSSAQGALGVAYAATGSGASQGSASGSTSIAKSLAASATGTSTASASVSASGSFGGSAAGTGTASGSLRATFRFTASASGQGSASGSLGVIRRLAGSAAGSSTASGTIGTPVLLSGSASATSSASAALPISKGLGASVSLASFSSGALRYTAALTGSAAGDSSSTSSLGAALDLGGSSTASGSASADLQREFQMAGGAAGSSSAFALLSIGFQIVKGRVSVSDRSRNSLTVGAELLTSASVGVRSVGSVGTDSRPRTSLTVGHGNTATLTIEDV